MRIKGFAMGVFAGGLLAAGAWAAAPLDIGSDALSHVENISSISGFVPHRDDYRIYYIGDSITRHGFNQSTLEKLGWDHVAGMAASSEDKDYAHLLAAKIAKQLSGRKIRVFFGKGHDSAGALSGLGAAAAYKPHLVVVQLGEHAKPAGAQRKTREDYDALMQGLLALRPRPLILCTGVWSPQRNHQSYSGWTADVERIQREICLQRKIPFASVEKYALDPRCSGTGASHGVKWHPNDQGMAGYAAELFALFKQHYKETPLVDAEAQPSSAIAADNAFGSGGLSRANGWRLWHPGRIKTQSTWEEDRLRVVIPDYEAPVKPDQIQLMREVALEPGKEYDLTFGLKATAPGSLTVIYVLSQPPWTRYASVTLDISPDQSEYRCRLKPEMGSDARSKPRSIRFFLGRLPNNTVTFSHPELAEAK
jgi:hypothetical protein